jgi:hypothetical protein
VTTQGSAVLSPNDRFLIAAGSPSSTDATQPGWARDPGFSWELALEQAAQNRIPAAAAQLALSEPLAPHVEGSLRERWRELSATAGQRAEAASQELRRIAEAMARHGVEPLLYKGLDIDALCYSPAARRSFNDIDIIVRPHHTEAAAAALRDLDYDLPPGNPPLDYYRRFHLHAIMLDSERRRLPVELHWAIESPHAGAPDVLPLVFEKATSDPGFGGVLRPDRVDSLALMSHHLEKHLGLSATLPTREARLESVIEDYGLLWLLDIVRWMRTCADADGQAVMARMRELEAEGPLATSLRLAADLDPQAQPAWAMAWAERLPGKTPLIARLVYPDLHAGGPPTDRARRLRAWGFRTLPEVGFAPLNALQALLPSPTVPGMTPLSPTDRLRRLPRKLGLIAANVVAVVRWRLDRWRGERRARTGALLSDTSPQPPTES